MFVQLWITHVASDFFGADMAEPFKTFLQKLQDLSMGKQAGVLKQLFDSKKEEAFQPPKEKSISMPSEARPFWTALTFGHVDIAQQLTMITAEKFRLVTPAAVANTPDWVPDEGKTLTTNSPIRQIIQWTNQIHAWVAVQVNTAADVRIRAKMLKHLGKIAQECYKHGDMNTSAAMCAAFKTLLTSEEKISKDYKEIRDLMETIERPPRKESNVTSPTKAFTGPPRIPVIQQYLVELYERSPVITNSASLGDILYTGPLMSEFLNSSMAPYPFLSIKAVKEFLSTPPPTPSNWQPLVAFARRPPKPPSSPNLPSSSGSGSLHRSRSKREAVPTPQTNLVTFLHSYPDVYELLLKVQAAEKLCDADLLSDRAREAVLLLDRFGGLTDGNYESASEHSGGLEDSKARRTVYTPMLPRPRSNNGTNVATDSGSRIIGPPPPVPTPTLDVTTRAEQWRVVLLQHGLPATHVMQYAKLFDDEEIEISQLGAMDERLLTALGLTEEHASLLLVGH